ncbi:MAG: hypothetical protein JOY94_11920 [Methylobacteriaceae bacterium]|nr:hypothetical protein [Methylobacteriaceae bacterium]
MSDERRMYPELLGNLADVSVENLQRILAEIASGTSSFGPRDEWRDWFHYLLPRLIPRSHETSVYSTLEVLITAVLTQYPTGLEGARYPGFREDVLGTVGQCLMDAVCWPDGVLDANVCLNRHFVTRVGLWFWDQASGPLSASMFLCLKYLLPQQVKPWLDSVLAIDEPHWRAQVMIWFLGAHGMLSGAVRQPSQFAVSDYPAIDWDWSHCLTGNYSGDHRGNVAKVEFISEANRRSAIEAVKGHFSEPVFLDWLQSFATDPSLEAELAETPYWFYDLYRDKSGA